MKSPQRRDDRQEGPGLPGRILRQCRGPGPRGGQERDVNRLLTRASESRLLRPTRRSRRERRPEPPSFRSPLPLKPPVPPSGNMDAAVTDDLTELAERCHAGRHCDASTGGAAASAGSQSLPRMMAHYRDAEDAARSRWSGWCGISTGRTDRGRSCRGSWRSPPTAAGRRGRSGGSRRGASPSFRRSRAGLQRSPQGHRPAGAAGACSNCGRTTASPSSCSILKTCRCRCQPVPPGPDRDRQGLAAPGTERTGRHPRTLGSSRETDHDCEDHL